MIDPRLIEAARAVPLPELVARTVKLKRNGREWVGRCPFHGERTPSFYVYRDHYHCYGCQAHGDAIEWMMQRSGLDFPGAVATLVDDKVQQIRWRPVATPPTEEQARRAETANFERAMRILHEALPAEGTPTEDYLNFRGLNLPLTEVLYYHPECPCGTEKRPAMIAEVTDPVSGKPCGIHRTFIRPDGRGKADVKSSKMLLGKRGVVRLVADRHIRDGLAVAEGIETALAVTQLLDAGPCWSACCAGGIHDLPALPGYDLTIFADNDIAGTDAAMACAERWTVAGADVITHVPPPGIDWLDAVLKGTKNGRR